MTPDEQDPYPQTMHLLARIEGKTDRQKHLMLAWIAGHDPHMMKRCLDKRDEHDAVQEALRLNDLPF